MARRRRLVPLHRGALREKLRFLFESYLKPRVEPTSGQPYGKVPWKDIEPLVDRVVQDHNRLGKKAIEEDWEFRFTVNYYLRENRYTNEPYIQLRQQIEQFFAQQPDGRM